MIEIATTNYKMALRQQFQVIARNKMTVIIVFLLAVWYQESSVSVHFVAA